MAAYWAMPVPVMMGSLGHVAFNATHAAFNAGLVGPGHAVLQMVPGRCAADLQGRLGAALSGSRPHGQM